MNDGDCLAHTLTELAARYPALQSIGVVPVGLTRYHRGSCRRYAPTEARAIVDQVTPFQQLYRERYGISLVYLADEWFLLAQADVPPAEMYDGFPQMGHFLWSGSITIGVGFFSLMV